MNFLPWRLRYAVRCLFNGTDVLSSMRFIAAQDTALGLGARLRFVRDIYGISYHVWCAHSQDEILEVARAVLRIPPSIEGVIVEAGCYKGGSTAKLSLLARLSNRKLVAFDSFEGLPENAEEHGRTIHGELADFRGGAYQGGLEEVTENVRRFGAPDRCRFVKGWFSDTMPAFNEPVVGAFLDVDLVSSTRDCLKYLFPRLQPGASLFSQDGHLPLVIEVLDSASFWQAELGVAKPPMSGLHRKKLVRIDALEPIAEASLQ